MKVWAIYEEPFDDERSVDKIFDTKEKALEYLTNTYPKSRSSKYLDLYIYEHEVE